MEVRDCTIVFQGIMLLILVIWNYVSTYRVSLRVSALEQQIQQNPQNGLSPSLR